MGERTVDSLILALLVDIVEVSEHFDSRQMGTGVVDNALAAVFHDVFQQLQGLADAK